MDRQERLEALADAVIPEAVEWVKELRKYRTYQGENAEYFRKARIGIGIIGAGVRICATIENGRTNDLVQQRLLKEVDALALGDGSPAELTSVGKAAGK